MHTCSDVFGISLGVSLTVELSILFCSFGCTTRDTLKRFLKINEKFIRAGRFDSQKPTPFTDTLLLLACDSTIFRLLFVISSFATTFLQLYKKHQNQLKYTVPFFRCVIKTNPVWIVCVFGRLQERPFVRTSDIPIYEGEKKNQKIATNKSKNIENQEFKK